MGSGQSREGLGKAFEEVSRPTSFPCLIGAFRSYMTKREVHCNLPSGGKALPKKSVGRRECRPSEAVPGWSKRGAISRPGIVEVRIHTRLIHVAVRC